MSLFYSFSQHWCWFVVTWIITRTGSFLSTVILICRGFSFCWHTQDSESCDTSSNLSGSSILNYCGVYLPVMSCRIQWNMSTQQFTNGSQLFWLWVPRNWSDPVHLLTTPLLAGNTRITHWVLLVIQTTNQKSFKLNTIYSQDTFPSRHENNNQSVY